MRSFVISQELNMDDKRLRLAIEDSATKGIVSANLLYCCIAALNNKINKSKSDEQVYKRYRNILAEIAIYKLNIDKETINIRVTTLSEGCYPSLKAVVRVMDMVDKGYIVDNSFIPDNLLKYEDKTVKSLAKIKETTTEEKHYIVADKTFEKICSFIEKEFIIDLNDYLQREILKAVESYSFSTVESGLRWEKNDILSSLRSRDLSSNSAKCKYFLGILKNKLPEIDKKIKQQELARKRAEEFAAAHADIYTEYKDNFKARPPKKINDRLKDLW